MSDEEILAKINQMKARVKEIVLNIQNLKKQLEQADISLEDFKENKIILEEELRGILQNIAQVKESTQIKVIARPKEISQEEKVETTKIIEKEIKIAEEAKDLMYYFQTDFEGSITRAKIYLSITLEDHFIMGIDFTDYPQRPILFTPPAIIELFNNDNEDFYECLSSYSNWDPKDPKRIYELITEIETVLINKYSADINTILKKSVEYVNQAKGSLEELIKEAKDKLLFKNYERTIELYYEIIDLAYNIQDYETAKMYTSKLNELLKKSDKNSK